MSAASLHARAVRCSLGGTVVLDGIDVTVSPGSRIGLVGPNGAGKTTLLRALAGRQRLDEGSVVLAPPTANIGFLPQETERRSDETLAEHLRRRTGVADAEVELDAASAALAAGTIGADERYANALDRYLGLGAPDVDARMSAVCADLSLPIGLADVAMAELSGGQAARASLAALLLARFDVFLLDEPTNDLDLDGLARLERWVADLTAGLVVVSHDRAFLERTVTSVLELDEVTHRTRLFGGGWLAYLEERETARRHAEKAYADYVDQRDGLRARAQQQREWSQQGQAKVKRSGETDKHIRRFKTAQTEKLAGKARATEQAMERLEEVDKPWEAWELRMQISTAERSGKVVRLSDATVVRGTFRLGPLDLEIDYGERVGILGPNGSGKTTLLDAIAGRVPLASGGRWVGPSVVTGELGQRRARYLVPEPLLDVFLDESGLLVADARSLLAKFGLGADHVRRSASTLSPGERTRAELAALMARGVNCLVLDEPTNHLDLPAIDQLEQALATWDATLLLVTHDRRLLEAVDLTRTIELT